jgi:hypothetical protein
MICNFSVPLNYNNEVPVAGEPFAFSNMTCISDSKEAISGRGEFWLSKQIDYGQILILTFCLIFFLMFVIKLAWNFVKQDFNDKL